MTKKSPLKSIKAHCLDCSGGSRENVRECPSSTCALFPYRLGKDPFRARPPKRIIEQGIKNLRKAKSRGC